MNVQIIRGAILNPRSGGIVDYLPDGVLTTGSDGRINIVGIWTDLLGWGREGDVKTAPRSTLILPPLLDCHTHVPQHPIRGRFTEGVASGAPEGQLLAGLARNVFPCEAKAANPEHAQRVVQEFAEDTLAKGVVGGAAYMTVHSEAVRTALTNLSKYWSVGLVLMNQNCPAYLRTDEENLQRDISQLARLFGKRLIVTDRFAVVTDTSLRTRAAQLAKRFGLRMQTHLNEQMTEKLLVEESLYPSYPTYTDVYLRDGLLSRDAILAHCIHMTPSEWSIIKDFGSSIAHCPTSNTLLESGTMQLDEVVSRRLPYAICTDMGASPTTSLLAEMAQFLKVHAGRSAAATPSEALWRCTLAPAQILGLDQQLGSFEIGKPLSYIEAKCDFAHLPGQSADEVIWQGLLRMGAAQSSDILAA